MNTFEDLNWRDPFPNKIQKLATNKWANLGGNPVKKLNQNKAVYDESKMNAFYPPNLIFIPSKMLLKKLMRVTTECKTPADLIYIF